MPASFPVFCDRTGLRDSLLVVAPHPDDETIGCGGLIALATAAGIRTTVVIVTDGGASHPGSVAWPPNRIAERRRLEAAVALQVLGAEPPPHFLDLPDGQTGRIGDAATRAACQRLADLLEHAQPDIVLTTWRREPHCDHRFAYALACDAMRNVASRALRVEYLVWTDLIGAPGDRPLPHETVSFQLDIDAVRARKRKALAAHRSQLGRLIRDDPTGFSLTPEHLRCMTMKEEHYELPHPGAGQHRRSPQAL